MSSSRGSGQRCQVTVQPRDKTLGEAEIEALSAQIVAAAAKAGGTLRG